ncbi:unnamed protein product [Chrysodeixis includens]|uniref:LRRCT domain-containing protein n=1 Tax=Chrysodeixis includens TaxID=689277 RepID=A0A9N8Q0Y8_CHRIL|nr:unnamed protein product [Chrysodeixis includens]
MLVHILLLALIAQVKTTSICDRKLCVCWVKNVQNEDYQGENVQCSYADADILQSNYELPDIVNSLDLSSNKIEKVQSSALLDSTTLIELLLHDNAITTIEINSFQLPELKRLDLSGNLLDHIHREVFRDLTKLEYLNLANNRFTTFTKMNFHHLSNLNDVILDNNNIGPSLKGTNLFDRSGSGLTNKIKSLSISGINLNTVPDNFFVDAYDISTLIISNNNISDVFEIPFTLKHLDLSDNPIRDISGEDFTDLIALQELNLDNLLIKEVPDYIFEHLPSLRKLTLERNNNLVNFSKLAFGRDVLDDPAEFKLERLSLKGSRLTRLDEALAVPLGELTELDLQGNPWKCDCNFVWVKTLQLSDQSTQHLRCDKPTPLFNAKVFDLHEKYFTCEIRHRGFEIAIVVICATLGIVAMWVFLCLPTRKTGCGFLKNMYGPSTAYSVLPMAASFHNDVER